MMAAVLTADSTLDMQFQKARWLRIDRVAFADVLPLLRWLVLTLR
jgi:hypothetical protein